MLCDSAISDHSIVPPPPHTHQFRINPGSVIVLDHFFLDIAVILNILKATTVYYIFSKHYFTLNTPVLSLLKALYYSRKIDLVYLYLYLYLIIKKSLYLYLYLYL